MTQPQHPDRKAVGRLCDIEPTLQAAVDAGLMGGAVTMIWRQGELAHVAAVGWRDVSARDPMRADCLFRIASMTKPIVSLAVMMLVEEGRLRLEDPVSRWIPELADATVLLDPAGPLHRVRPSPRPITIEDLLTHRSGLATPYTAPGALGAAYAARLGLPLVEPRSPDDWLRALGELPLMAAPGERFTYSCGLDVLGFLVARLEERSLGEVLRQRILDPLGMADTGFWAPGEKRRRLARLYQAAREGRSLTEIALPLSDGAPVFESGGGGLFSTAGDYLAFARLMLGRGELEGVRILRPETVDLMTRNRLTASQRETPFPAVAGAWRSQGFGLGVSMILEPDRSPLPGTADSYTWPGAFGTWWLADPARDMVLLYMMQDYLPLSIETLADGAAERTGGRRTLAAFRRLAYEAFAG